MAGGVVRARYPRSVRALALQGLATFAICAPVTGSRCWSSWLFGTGIGAIVGSGSSTPGRTSRCARIRSPGSAYLLVPWMVAGAPLAAICLRLTASGMRDVDDADFIRTALGKGLSAAAVAFRALAARPRSAPTIAFAGSYTPLLVGNALLVEQVFNIPGVFRYTPRRDLQRRLPAAAGDDHRRRRARGARQPRRRPRPRAARPAVADQ